MVDLRYESPETIEAAVALLAEYGLAVSTGSACSSGRRGVSHVLAAMQVGEEERLIATIVASNRANRENLSSFDCRFERATLRVLARTRI